MLRLRKLWRFRFAGGTKMTSPKAITMVLSHRGKYAQWLMPHNLLSGKKELIQSAVSKSTATAVAAFSQVRAFISGCRTPLVAERFLLDFI